MPRTERAIRDRCGAAAALLLALCAGASAARAQAPAHRVADLQTAPASNLLWPDPTSSDPGGFARLGAQALFWARTPQSGVELWSTDGSEAGTHFVKEVAFPGSIGPQMTFYPSVYSVPGLPPPMLGGALYFAAGGSAPSAIWGSALWRSDGTAEGTALLELLLPGGVYPPEVVAMVGPLLYFFVFDYYGGGTRTLWRTDGTEAGTLPILSGETVSYYPEAYAGLDGTLYFRFEQALWKSDGTAEPPARCG